MEQWMGLRYNGFLHRVPAIELPGQPLLRLRLLWHLSECHRAGVQIPGHADTLANLRLRSGPGPGATSPPAQFTPAPDRDKVPAHREGTSLPSQPGDPNRTSVGQQQEVETRPGPTPGGSREPGNKPSGRIFRGQVPTRTEAEEEALAEAEAALKKLKEHPDDKQAADALEQALQRLRERAKPEGQTGNPAKP